jgi:hypothetical protein
MAGYPQDAGRGRDMKHTPEPWELRKMHGTEMWGAKSHISDWFLFEFALEKDAARIVACVNACVGMDDPAKYMEGVRILEKTYYDLQAEKAILRNERDELLSALEMASAVMTACDALKKAILRNERNELLEALEMAAAVMTACDALKSAQEQVRQTIAKMKGTNP